MRAEWGKKAELWSAMACVMMLRAAGMPRERQIMQGVSVSRMKGRARACVYRDDLADVVEILLAAGSAAQIQQSRNVSSAGIRLALSDDNLPTQHTVGDRNRLAAILTKDCQAGLLFCVVAHKNPRQPKLNSPLSTSTCDGFRDGRNARV
jgi:hypothetical protein